MNLKDLKNLEESSIITELTNDIMNSKFETLDRIDKINNQFKLAKISIKRNYINKKLLIHSLREIDETKQLTRQLSPSINTYI